MRELWNKLRALWPSVFMFLFTAGLGFAAIFIWPWLSTAITTEAPSTQEEASTIFRNLFLIFLGGYGIYLADRRLKAIDRQHILDKRSALFDRFQRSSAMLADPSIGIRQAGILSLTEIAIEEPEEFYIQVQGLICGFLRQASAEVGDELRNDLPFDLQEDPPVSAPNWPEPRGDMVDALNGFRKLRKTIANAAALERSSEFEPNLSRLFVPGFDLQDMNFENCNLTNSVFSDSVQNRNSFIDVVLDGSSFDRATLYNCAFADINASYLAFRWTEIRGGGILGGRIARMDSRNSFAEEFQVAEGVIGSFRLDDWDSNEQFPTYTAYSDFQTARLDAMIAEGPYTNHP